MINDSFSQFLMFFEPLRPKVFVVFADKQSENEIWNKLKQFLLVWTGKAGKAGKTSKPGKTGTRPPPSLWEQNQSWIVVPFFSGSQVLTKKSSNFSFKMTLSFGTKKVVIWWLFDDDLRAREREPEEKETTNSEPQTDANEVLYKAPLTRKTRLEYQDKKLSIFFHMVCKITNFVNCKSFDTCCTVLRLSLLYFVLTWENFLGTPLIRSGSR